MQAKIAALQACLADRTLYCGGTFSVSPDELVLYYGKNDDEHSHRINFSRASEEQLELLSQTCQPATFGVNQQDVLDESYRKAGKMDTTDFATRFSAESVGLVDVIRKQLLQDSNQDKGIRLEMYKLNVYGKDSFFKAHQDTPRGQNMFGSLVIVFPTNHDGGALVLRHGGKEWTFDSSGAISAASGPCVGYVAFYSDVEHEVTLVKSGYRVTITYNLYFEDESKAMVSVDPAPTSYEITMKAALSDLLSDPGVLPEGGYLGFGLRHQYPVNSETDIQNLVDCLKGSDAVIASICDQLALPYSLKVFYRSPGWESSMSTTNVLFNEVVDLRNWIEVEDVVKEMLNCYDGQVVKFVGEGGVPLGESMYSDSDSDSDSEEKYIDVLEVVDMNSVQEIETCYAAYGNEASVGHIYGHICLMVKVEAIKKSENHVVARHNCGSVHA
ncbi:hypothetical protein SERLA73DRAFT_90914 [Serpula lacrymans var. lacrymans S7.3]|uniref:Prolyl 4-hydroxylase alpha subunit Fe(2+) 2OG dioxygenase domain-containing protein n=2 Tax=Serpula lacrymans var. lacrymans TaxID=341189 RepID=F8Q0H6_SERL3|nr:uncharacterized protein SERLADRAFT_469268 [Serpula lacrymans var. lacrymans S7.9]EGN97805.1 hypothetical protein SERLA73DRAFT_90914 [Serpula lacrymans var. lacrymans S7.3]EGO23397.1 hypothetical protein SERLADRAFT_469268 [Serpula lacrymans var. lacrymans S7.9]